jgi:hypothetical protein
MIVGNILNNCKVNGVISIVVDGHKRICRVMDVRDTDKQPITFATLRRWPDVVREGQFLVKCQDTSGEIRSFYSEVNVSGRKVNPIVAAILYARGKLPAKVTV